MIRSMVGRRHGVYALYRKSRLYYVGLANNLRGRIKNHVRDRHAGKWDSFSMYLTIDDSHMRELESLLIRIASPKGNKQRGRFARAENLMTVLKAEVKDRQRQELDSLGHGGAGKDPLRSRRRRRIRRTRGAPALAGLVQKPMPLRGMHKKQVFKARARKNGTVKVGSRVFTSPSSAASHVLGRQANGWWFWKYQRAPGVWVRLNELKRR
jgi:hypothetical protein